MYLNAFEATQAYGTAQLAALKLLVKSVCVLAALIVVGVSVWTSISMLGDAVFIQMWTTPLNSWRSGIKDAIAALTDPGPWQTDPVCRNRLALALRQKGEQGKAKILAQQKDVQKKMLTPPTGGDTGDGAGDGQLPVGTRGRRGDTWYVKQADGSWQPEGQPNG